MLKFSFLVLYLCYSSCGANSKLRLDDVAYWIQNSKILSSRNCYVLNYGWKNVEAFETQIQMSLKNEKMISFHHTWGQSPGNCWIVLVGQENLQNVDQIDKKLDEILNELMIINAQKMFLFEKIDDKLPHTIAFKWPKVKYSKFESIHFFLTGFDSTSKQPSWNRILCDVSRRE